MWGDNLLGSLEWRWVTAPSEISSFCRGRIAGATQGLPPPHQPIDFLQRYKSCDTSSYFRPPWGKRKIGWSNSTSWNSCRVLLKFKMLPFLVGDARRRRSLLPELQSFAWRQDSATCSETLLGEDGEAGWRTWPFFYGMCGAWGNMWRCKGWGDAQA